MSQMDETGVPERTTLAGRYQLGALLGNGGMGAVRDATDLRLARSVAVKMLRADLAAQPAARRRFETEAHSAARLAHPNVVTVYDCGEEDGVPFLVMERLPGRTLADELAAGPLSLVRVRLVAHEILAALAAAHGAGIIHRDIKPGNVLLTEDGHVKVSDFGIAKTADAVDQTQTLELIATPAYLAPERLNGQPATPRSDLYSVGVLLYEALAGRRPFDGDTPVVMMRAIERGEAVSLTSLRPTLPAELISTVARAMALDPDRRFESAAEMASALEPQAELDETVAIATVFGPETVPIDPAWRDGDTRTLPLPNTPSREGEGPRPRVSRRAAAIAVGALLAVVLVAGIVSNQRDGAVPGPSVPTVKPTTPTTVAVLAAPLDDAIRRLEQVVAK
jgi:eukaryotic-like serine/threonine-protein kinase